jgi:hypothetical protein
VLQGTLAFSHCLNWTRSKIVSSVHGSSNMWTWTVVYAHPGIPIMWYFKWSGLSTSTFGSQDFIRQDLSGPWRGSHYLCFSLNEPSCQGLVWGVLNIWGEQLLITLEQHVMQNQIKFCFTHMMFLEILTGLTSKREVQCLADPGTWNLWTVVTFRSALTCVAFEIIASRGWLVFIVQNSFHVASQIQSDLKFLSDLGKLSLSLQPYDKT